MIPLSPAGLLSLLERALHPERQREPVPGAELLPGFDTVDAFPLKLKLPVRDYQPGELRPVITIHVTDVHGGFGVAAYQITPWRRALGRGKVPPKLLAQLPDPSDIGGSAYLLALLERYSRDAYHSIGSRRAGAVRNHPVTRRTSHGNTGNLGPGWALDCAHDEPLSEALVTIGRSSLAALIEETSDACGGATVTLVPHRVWAGDRGPDPDRETWQRVVLPVQEEAGAELVAIGYETKAGDGRYIPTSWDPAAHFDAKGKRVRPAG